MCKSAGHSDIVLVLRGLEVLIDLRDLRL